MEKTLRRTPRMVFIVACCAVLAATQAFAGEPQPNPLPPEEQQEYLKIQQRVLKYQNTLTMVFFTFAHCADEKEAQRLKKTLGLFQAFMDNARIPALAEAGGIKAFKAALVQMLKNKDSVVRGSAAMFLAIIGEIDSKAEIAKLLEPKPPMAETAPIEDGVFENVDCSRAAMALGLLGAKEYAPKLAGLLGHRDHLVRSGAVQGLAGMEAKEYVKQIAALLEDDQDDVQIAAMAALGELGAQEYAKKIAGKLGDSVFTAEAACYSLARLKATEHAKDIAKLLTDDFRKGDAAKALALMGVADYNKEIAALMDDPKPLPRCDGLIAIGILGAKEYTGKAAEHLQDKQEYVRKYAAVALLLMGDEAHAKDILRLVASEGDIESCLKFAPDMQDQLVQRAMTTLNRLKQAGKPEEKKAE